MSQTHITTEEIWKLLSGKLRSFLRQQVGDETLAEDLLQETFIRIHNGIQSLKDSERTSAWVFRIARNTIADHFRHKHRMEPRLDEPEIQTDGTDKGNMNAIVAEWLPTMLSELPEKYREALELFELQDVPQQEIAHRLDLSLSGAKSRIQRGRKKLKDTLLQCCHVDFDRRGNVIGIVSQSTSCSCCKEGCEPEV